MFLAGSLTQYMEIREAMARTGVDKLIEADFDHALRDRKNAMRTLLNFDGDQLDDETRSPFYFRRSGWSYLTHAETKCDWRGAGKAPNTPRETSIRSAVPCNSSTFRPSAAVSRPR